MPGGPRRSPHTTDGSQGHAPRRPRYRASRWTAWGFRRLLETVAHAWNEGDTNTALACFTDDARYTEPPDEQHYEGRDQLSAFFGGEDPPPMRMDWHTIVFDEGQQMGAAEYTFIGTNTYHGVVMIRLRDDLVANWRGYQHRSDLDWEGFTRLNPF